ncbi:rod-determining factor RdfA [Haladaptatus sp. CMSO5]|uniref:rod-determining factor RdfA n=1 Tax=Haladaptatus sp. CMSO5 TaxID=3120514 RepID=UPI002FCE1117
MATQTRCKLDIVAERYDLDAALLRYGSLDEHLLTRWTGADGDEPAGYRSLAKWFNLRLLTRVYDEHGREVTGSRVESDYAALTGGDDIVREEVLDDMRADGINADLLEADLISWSTMRQHLKECLSGTKPIETAKTEWEQKSVNVAKHVSASKVSEALSSLDTKQRLPGASTAEVEMQVLLSCPHCMTRIPFEDALDRGFICKDHLQASVASE